LAQLEHGVVQAGSNGANGNGEHLGDLLIGELVLEFEHQSLALRPRELRDRGAHRLKAGVFAGRWRRGWFDQFVDRFPPPKRIETDMTRDPKQVSAARHCPVKPFAVLEGANKRILEQIFGGSSERRLVPEKGQQGWPRFAVELLQLFHSLVHQAVFHVKTGASTFEYVEPGGP